MAPRLTWLGDLKLAQLRHLAVSLGANSSGTKLVLTQTLESRLSTSIFPASNDTPSQSRSRLPAGESPAPSLISIDMGIKNLAYCRLQSPTLTTTKKGMARQSGKTQLVDWKRIDVTAHQSHFLHQDSASLPSSTPTELSNAKPKAKPKVTAPAYHPGIYASAAYSILTSLLHAHPSSHVVIERQRFRSMGGKSVLEWTLKVNMFEAMLYAVLETMKHEGRWWGEVSDVRPGHVSLFWLGRDEEGAGAANAAETAGGEGKAGPVGVKKSEKKRETIELVRKWIEERVLDVEGKAEETARGFMVRRRARGAGKEGGKLDDLADCLAQGMAVFKWEENRRLLLEKGKEGLSLPQ